MKIPFSGLTGPVLDFANGVQRGFDGLLSVRLRIVDAATDLPNATAWNGRQIIVRDIDGAGNPGVATALDGDWYNESWSVI